jgi:pseudaminic acid biosynthesis-associated methylase
MPNSRKATKNSANAQRTNLEEFWAGSFGDAYTARNMGDENWLANNIALFARILHRTGKIRSAIEFGANRGINLQALRSLFPDVHLEALEINERAAGIIRKKMNIKVHHNSIFEFKPKLRFELSLIKGVLIHISPDRLKVAYKVLYESSSRYICLAEYYNPTPVTVPYRGHDEILFKRDFAGEMLKTFSDLKLLDYGFVYHNDPSFPQGDITWFLLEKRERK